MRPAEFTPEQIIEAGQALQAAGRNITGFALRQKVGGGNPTRLKQVWDEHASSQVTAVAEPVAELPEDVAEAVANVSKSLADRLAALAVELNDRAVKAADRRVHEVVRSAGEQRTQAERELADAAETVDDLENQLDAANASVAWQEKRLADTQAANQAQAVELAQVRERLTAAEQTSKAAAQQHAAELARLAAAAEAERTRHQQEADQVRADLARARDEMAQAHAATEAARAEVVKAQAKAEAQAESHAEQRKTAAAEAHRAAERMAQAQAERDEARRDASTARESAANLSGKLEAMQAQIADLVRALAERPAAAASAEPAAKAPATKTAKKSCFSKVWNAKLRDQLSPGKKALRLRDVAPDDTRCVLLFLPALARTARDFPHVARFCKLVCRPPSGSCCPGIACCYSSHRSTGFFRDRSNRFICPFLCIRFGSLGPQFSSNSLFLRCAQFNCIGAYRNEVCSDGADQNPADHHSTLPYCR